MEEIYHILPIDDIKEHEESSLCECSPTVEVYTNGNVLIIHNSFDRREVVEDALRIINEKDKD